MLNFSGKEHHIGSEKATWNVITITEISLTTPFLILTHLTGITWMTFSNSSREWNVWLLRVCLHHSFYSTFAPKFRNINEGNCKTRSFDELHLKGDISWGADVQFKNEALQATRLANFISAFMQVVDPKEVFPGTRVTDKPLTEDQMIGRYINVFHQTH